MARSIEIQGLGKRYTLGEGFHRYETLRGALAGALGRRTGKERPWIWALRDIDLTVAEGEAVGVIGRNGAGKTTLLKIVARITEPTKGVARTRGRVGALLEVGTGFHPELTGRENIFLNGAVLGLSRREVRRRFDDIVAFAGVEQFLDTPLKRYSSGMYLRLAFAVAAHVEPEIVVVDEVLAVGDAEFHRRCLGKMSEMGREGRTVLFVSHDLGAINQLCPRTIWLDGGRIRTDGPTDATLAQYLTSVSELETRIEFEADARQAIQLLSVSVAGVTAGRTSSPRRDQPLSLHVRFRVRERVQALDFGFQLRDARGFAVLEEYWSDSRPAEHPADEPGEYEASMTVPAVLAAGDYVVSVWIGSTYDDLHHDEVLRFRLSPAPQDRQESLERDRIVEPPVTWQLEVAEIAQAPSA